MLKIKAMIFAIWSESSITFGDGLATNMKQFKITAAPYLMLALTLIGITDAVYVAHGRYTGQVLWCPIVEGCNVVVNSPYSQVFGVPLSYFGFIYYLYMFALAARLAFDPLSRGLRFRAVLYSAMGAVSSAYFIYLQLNYIREVCSYCLISAATSLLLFMAAVWHSYTIRNLSTGVPPTG